MARKSALKKHNKDLQLSFSPATEAFTLSFTSFSIILLAFFIFIDSISMPDLVRRSEIIDSLGGQFVYGDRPMDDTPRAIIEIAESARFEVTREGDRFVISMPGGELFDSGDDRIRPDKQPVLEALADRIAAQDLYVRIEGHTDSNPIATLRFASNWELSSSRAISVLRLFLARGIDETRLSAAGRSEFNPVADNSTEEGRALNRRVVLYLAAHPSEEKLQ